MALSDQPTLLDMPRPVAPAGSVRVFADQLDRLLDRLNRFVGGPATAITLRHVWLETIGADLVGFASDRGSGAEANIQNYTATHLPQVGITCPDASALRKMLKKAHGLVDLSTVGEHLAVAEGGEELVRVPVRVPTPTDQTFVAQQVNLLATAWATACDSSELPFGATRIKPKVLGRFDGAPDGGAGIWFAPHGRAFIEVDDTFRGFAQAARAGTGNVRRPLPRKPIAATASEPTRKAAA